MQWLLEFATAVTWLFPESCCLCEVFLKTTWRAQRSVNLQGHVLLWSPISPSAATTFLHGAPRLRGGEKLGVDGSIPGLIWRRILDATWVQIVNVAFSWALFGKEAWWRHRHSGWLEERDDVITRRRREGPALPVQWKENALLKYAFLYFFSKRRKDRENINKLILSTIISRR